MKLEQAMFTALYKHYPSTSALLIFIWVLIKYSVITYIAIHFIVKWW